MKIERGATIESVVLLRAIAAFGVCVTHFFIINGISYENPLIVRMLMLGSLGVPVFFVISGFILPYALFKKQYAARDFKSFLLKRFVRIEPPYWATILLLTIFGLVQKSTLSFTGLALNLSYLVPIFPGYHWFNPVFWTLAIEFQYYILLGICFPALLRLQGRVAVLLLVALSMLLVLSGLEVKEFFFSWTYDFVAGYIIFEYFVSRISLRFAISTLFLLSLFLCFTVSLLTGLTPLLTGLVLLLIDYKFPRPVLLLGNMSYSLYLTHSITMNLWLPFFKKYVINQVLLGGSSIVLSVVLAYIFYRLVERPVLVFSQKSRLKGS